jgi:hypothetical protein
MEIQSHTVCISMQTALSPRLTAKGGCKDRAVVPLIYINVDQRRGAGPGNPSVRT